MTKGILPKPLHITLLLITLTLVSAAANRILGSKPNPPALFTIGLEAEQGLLIPPMVINSTASASGDAYLSSNTRDAGIVTFSVDLANDGNYMIWGRVLAPDLYRDSFFVSIDGGPEDVYDVANDIWSDSWQWTRVNGRADAGTPLTVNPRIFELSAGSHEIVFRAREPDTKLDRLIITNDLSFVPDDAGPAPGPTPPPPPTGGRQFYAAAQGRPDGDGSQNNPWSLPAVMGHPTAVRPGDTIYLRGGTYNLRGQLATHISYLTGTADAPITVRSFPGERAIIDWDYVWLADGAYTHYVGLEFMSSGLRKVYPPEAGSWPDGRPPSLNVRGRHIKIINCIIHDIGGTGANKEAIGFELYGNLMYYIGFTSGRTWGTTAYVQSEVGPVRIADNLMFHQFAHNLQLYGSDAAYVRNIHVEGNTMFTPGALGPNRGYNAVVWPGALPAENITFLNNYTYSPIVDGTNVSIPGANGVTNRNLTLRGNYFLGGAPALRLGQWSPTTFTNNTLSSQYGLVWAWLDPNFQYSWNHNSYYYEGSRPDVMFEAYGSFHSSFAAWKQASRLDGSSTLTAGRPTGVSAFVRPNRYEQGRAHITVINFDRQDAANVDLGPAGLRLGQGYEIRDAQNYFGPPVVVSTYDGTPVRLPLDLTAVTPIIGAGQPMNAAMTPPAHTAKEFNAFVLLPR